MSNRRSPRDARVFEDLVAFAGAMVHQDTRRARAALRGARARGAMRVEAEETALMLMLHAGYPAALEGMMVLEDEWPGRAQRRVEGGVTAWRRRGERLCRQVYGSVYPRLIERVRMLHPDLAVMMVEQGYGRVLSRGGLDQSTRELVAVTVLAAGGWERQLVSHVMGALRLGADPGDVRLAVRAGTRGASATTRTIARRALRFGLSNGRRTG